MTSRAQGISSPSLPDAGSAKPPPSGDPEDPEAIRSLFTGSHVHHATSQAPPPEGQAAAATECQDRNDSEWEALLLHDNPLICPISMVGVCALRNGTFCTLDTRRHVS